MTDRPDPDAKTEAEIAEGFASGADRYGDMIIDPDHEPWLNASARRKIGEYFLGDGLLAEAAGLLAEQALQRIGSDLEDFINALEGRARTDDHARSLLLALLLVGRRIAESAQIRSGEITFGDHLRGLEQLVIEPDALIGDFEVDFLLTYSQLGPNPAAREDPSAPGGLTVIRRLALVRDRHHRDAYRDDIIRRQALGGSLEITAVSYDDSDVARDPFALASRVVRDLAQATTDELYG